MCNVCAASDALGKGITTGGYEMRATGKAEFAPAKYQIRKVGDPWPEHWADTTDLAGTAGAMGFDDMKSNAKVQALRAALAKSLKNVHVYAIYPRLVICHQALIWDDAWSDVWSDPIGAFRSWYRRTFGPQKCVGHHRPGQTSGAECVHLINDQ